LARILIVDDDPLTRRVIRRTLEREGYEIFEAGDGDAGVRAFRENLPDLVILDIYMPEKEGLEAILDLRTEFKDVKIIAISGGGGIFKLDPLQTAKHFGVAETLIKPIDRDILLASVRATLEGQR